LILFTPAFKRLRLPVLALGAVACAFLLVSVALQAGARRVLATGEVYPYGREDWLRYLVPELWPSDGKLLLMMGPSPAREDLLVEEFAAAFTEHRVFQGTFSLGTLGDVMAALEYVERVYGTAALPRILILGTSPRFLAEIPADRPFSIGINRYSRWYRVPGRSANGFGLEAKSALSGLFDHTEFMLRKQQPRYAAMYGWLVLRIVDWEPVARVSRQPSMQSGLMRLLLPGKAYQLGLHEYARELTAPNKYRNAPPPDFTAAALAQSIDHPNSWWKSVFLWDAAQDAPAIRERVQLLRDFTSQRGIEMYVVNLPESSPVRSRYDPERYDRYRALLHTVLDTVPLLDLHCALPDVGFYDADHARFAGARSVTERVIEFVREVRAYRVAHPDSANGGAAIGARLDAGRCVESPKDQW
jgi:hypothetical protein